MSLNLIQDFINSSKTLELNKKEQKKCLGIADDYAPQIDIQWFLSVSVDAQERARSIIEIANGITTISEKSKDRLAIPDIISDFFGRHENLIAHLSDYDKSERLAQIGAVVAVLKHQ